jgi:hypothetical protein
VSDYLKETPAYKRAMELVHAHTLHRNLSGSNNLYSWDNGLTGDRRVVVSAYIHGDGSGNVMLRQGDDPSNVVNIAYQEDFRPDPEAERRYDLFRKHLALHGDYIEFSRKANKARDKKNRERYDRIADALCNESQRLYNASGVR